MNSHIDINKGKYIYERRLMVGLDVFAQRSVVTCGGVRTRFSHFCFSNLLDLDVVVAFLLVGCLLLFLDCLLLSFCESLESAIYDSLDLRIRLLV